MEVAVVVVGTATRFPATPAMTVTKVTQLPFDRVLDLLAETTAGVHEISSRGVNVLIVPDRKLNTSHSFLMAVDS